SKLSPMRLRAGWFTYSVVPSGARTEMPIGIASVIVRRSRSFRQGFWSEVLLSLIFIAQWDAPLALKMWFPHMRNYSVCQGRTAPFSALRSSDAESEERTKAQTRDQLSKHPHCTH